MSTIKTKNIKQTVIGSTTQPLTIGGIASDNSDAKISIDTSGNVTLNNLSNTLNLTSGQIKFPATQNPSSDANTLDDYEEGTWTPTVTSEVGSITTYSATGKYTLIGRIFHFEVYIGIGNKGTAGGDIIVTMPFVVPNSKLIYGREGSTGNSMGGVTSSLSKFVSRRYDNVSAINVSAYYFQGTFAIE